MTVIETTAYATDGSGMTTSVAGKQWHRRSPWRQDIFQALVNTAPSVVVCLSIDGKVVEFNPRAEALYDRSREDVFGLEFFKFGVSAEMREVATGVIGHVIKDKQTGTFEDIVADTGGDARTVRWNLNALIDGEDKVVGVIAVGQDITELEMVKAELQETLKTLSAKHEALEKKDIALREVLHRIDDDKKLLASEIRKNVDRIIMPIVRKLADKTGSAEENLIQMLRSSLTEMTSPFINRLENRFTSLTPREIEVCNMIKNGLTSKEIAAALASSPETVRSQRKNIRRKLGISKSDRNLASFLSGI